MGGRPAPPHRLRRRPRSRHPELRPRRRLRDLPRLADRLGHTAHPARRDPERRRRGAARAGPHRHRPSRGPGHRRTRRLERDGTPVASRPPPSPTSPRSGTTATSSSSTCAAPRSTRPRGIEDAVNIPLHELSRPARRGPAGEVWVHCAGRLPRLGRGLDARRRRADAGRDRRHLRQRRRRSGCTWSDPRRRE